MPEVITQGQVAYDATAAIVLTRQAEQALADAKDFTIDSPEMLEAAGDDLKAVKTRQKGVEEQRTRITQPLNQVLRAVNDLFRPPAEYLNEAERILKGAMLLYTTEQERLAAAARRAAEEDARKERARLAAIEQEQQAAALAAQQAADRALQAAQVATDAGDTAAAAAAQREADALADAANTAIAEAEASAQVAEVITMAPTVTAPARVRGVSTSTTVDFEVSDLLALVQHVAANPDLLNLVLADSVKLRAYVRGLGMNCKLPGVRVFEKKTMSARAA